MRLLFIFFISLFLVTFSSQAQVEPQKVERKRVGLVLSGGGAKGMAHIGALKVIKEAGIPIDYISGTSMGAILGGMTALGYSTTVLDSIARNTNWTELFTDKVSRVDMSYNQKVRSDKYLLSISLNKDKKLDVKGLTSGQNVLNMLREFTINYHDSIDFNTLPIPFACVAHDMVKGEDIVIRSGDLPLAIRSSMSIPGAFVPVRRDGMVLVDGGISNNYPVNVARDMGADIIIGVDVGSGVLKEDEINGLTALFDQLTTLYGLENNKNNIANTDLYIRPDIQPYTALDFSPVAIDTLIHRGEVAARNQWEQLLELKKEIGVPLDYKPDYDDDKVIAEGEVEILSVDFEGLNKVKIKEVARIINFKEGGAISIASIYESVRRLQGSGLFSYVNYRLDGEAPYNLVFVVNERSRNSLNLGFRFDTKEMAAILLNATFAIKDRRFSEIHSTVRLSENPYALISYNIGSAIQRKSAVAYKIGYTDFDLYKGGDKIGNIDYLLNEVDLSFSNIKFRNLRVGLGIIASYYDFSSIYSTDISSDLRPESETLINWYASLSYDTLDELYYPTRGISVKAHYALHSNNFITYNDSRPFGTVYAEFTSALSISSRVTFIPKVYARFVYGDEIAFTYSNFIGGSVSSRYLKSQIPFVGLRNIESVGNSLVVPQIAMRVGLWSGHYVSVLGNYARYTDKWVEFKDASHLWGAGVKYSYNSLIGPLELLIDISGQDLTPGVYFNFGYYF